MTKYSALEALEKREKIHNDLWEKIGTQGQISIPMLTKEVLREFNYKDKRSALMQIKLMQVEMRVVINLNFTVKILKPL